MPARPHLVVALAYDRLCTFEFGCVVELFALPRPELDVPWYDFAVCAAERGPLRAPGGLTLTPPDPHQLPGRATALVGSADAAPPPRGLRRARPARAAARAGGGRRCGCWGVVWGVWAGGVR